MFARDFGQFEGYRDVREIPEFLEGLAIEILKGELRLSSKPLVWIYTRAKFSQ